MVLVFVIHIPALFLPPMQGVHSLLIPLTFVLLAAEPSTKAVWKCTEAVSGRTVCDNSWGIAEAEVVCRQLGYGYAILAIQGAAFGQGSGRQWDRVWSCNGNEANLNGCSSSSAFCTHSEDASVICSATGET